MTGVGEKRMVCIAEPNGRARNKPSNLGLVLRSLVMARQAAMDASVALAETEQAYLDSLKRQSRSGFLPGPSDR